ncbi:MAG: PepSY-like domain-containing protein [Muribaculaceae bacterium]|nr:PepSY-like domain-containing protein [Muribaculaceae bacterium]
MKKLFLIIAVLFAFMSASARDNYSHDVKVLPASAQSILKQNFKADVSHIKIGKEFGKIRKYDVVLTDGSEITFDKHGNWKDIEVNRYASVPSSLIPNPITSYIKNNQNKENVTGIEKSHYGYDVELSNGVEMKFTEKGKFIRYDD